VVAAGAASAGGTDSPTIDSWRRGDRKSAESNRRGRRGKAEGKEENEGKKEKEGKEEKDYSPKAEEKRNGDKAVEDKAAGDKAVGEKAVDEKAVDSYAAKGVPAAMEEQSRLLAAFGSSEADDKATPERNEARQTGQFEHKYQDEKMGEGGERGERVDGDESGEIGSSSPSKRKKKKKKRRKKKVGGEEGEDEGGAEHGTADKNGAGIVTITPPTQVLSPSEGWIDPSTYQPTSLGEGTDDDQGAWASPTSTTRGKSATATATAAGTTAAGAVATGTPVSAGTSVATTASTPGWDRAAETELIAMGFSRVAVEGALRASGGDKHTAVDMLLSGG
jgi:hypothetical protein